MGKTEVQSKEGAGEAWWWSSGSSKEGEGTDWLLMSSLRRHPEALSQTPIAAKASPPPPRHDSLRESKGGEGICCQTPAPRRGARGESGNEKQIPELRMCRDPISRVGSAGDGINHQHLTELLGRGPAGGQPWPGWLYQRHQWDLEQMDVSTVARGGDCPMSHSWAGGAGGMKGLTRGGRVGEGRGEMMALKYK